MSRSRSDRWPLAAAALAGVLILGGCGAGSDPAATSTPPDQWPIVLPDTPGASSPAPATADPATPVTTAVEADPIADLEVEDQSGDGREVTIESVVTGRDRALLVISSVDGEVLGVKQVSPRSQPVSVQLLKPVTTSQELIASLYLDNSNDGFFDSARDAPLVDEDGEPVREDFDYVVQ